MSAEHERLDKCTDEERRLALCWLIGYNPQTFDRALRSVERHRRIPEPGPWGVVEARCDAFEQRVRWVHGDPTEFGNDWHTFGGSDDSYHRVWSDLIDPTLVREGLS